MDKYDTSDPAFPVDGRIQIGDAYSGMSLRDYFAAQALPSVILQCASDGYRGPLTIEERFAANANEVGEYGDNKIN